MTTRLPYRRSVGLLALVLFAVSLTASDAGPAPRQGQARVTVVLNAHRYEFAPARIEAAEGDIVKVTLVAEDIPHSFTVDSYRISKRAAPGRPVTFEFRAEYAGTFQFYCDLTIDDGCKGMRGELVVTPRRRTDQGRRGASHGHEINPSRNCCCRRSGD
jgi:cytochrome c oxidase subunit II